MKQKNRYFKILLVCAFIVFISALIFLNYFGLTLYDMPKPTGHYSVGNTRILFQNIAHNVDPKYIAFMGDVFYPTQKTTSDEKYPYQPEKMKALAYELPSITPLPEFVWSRLLTGIYTYTQPHAPLVAGQKPFPVIIYLPGINSIDTHNAYLEELASHGYVVFAIEPPYDVTVSVFPNDKVITVDPFLQKISQENNRTEIYKYRDQAHVRWTGYIESAIGHIKELNADTASMLYQKLDTNNIGLLGHSHGGAVAADFCQKSSLCKAGINMDGWTKTYNTSDVFKVPFMFLLAGVMPEMEPLFENNKNNGNFKKIVVDGADHGSFNDGVLAHKPFVFWPNTKNEKLRNEISKIIIEFFDANLKRGLVAS